MRGILHMCECPHEGSPLMLRVVFDIERWHNLLFFANAAGAGYLVNYIAKPAQLEAGNHVEMRTPAHRRSLGAF